MKIPSKTMLFLAAGVLASVANAEDQSVFAPRPESADPATSVFAPRPTGAARQGESAAKLTLQFDATYLSDYVYRGVDYTKVSSRQGVDVALGMQLSLDPGPGLPKPFVSLETNGFDADPESHWQFVRPTAGVQWTWKSVTLTGGLTSSIYPNRDDFNTSEVFTQAQLDDSKLWGTPQPLLNPSLLAAYDYDLNNGWYVQAGISHDFSLGQTGLTLTPVARIGYTAGWQQEFVFQVPSGTGWQHYDLGIEARYALNSLMNLPKRYGQWSLKGSLFHTERLAESTVGSTITWAGLGIAAEY